MSDTVPGLIFFALVSTVAFLTLAPIALQLIGLPWAPAASFICARVARGRGLDVRTYAIAGAVYSALLFWPWVYLVLRMMGRTPPSVLIRCFYVFVYGVWAAGSTMVLLILAIAGHPGAGSMYDFMDIDVLFSYLGYLGVSVNLVVVFISQRQLRRRHAELPPVDTLQSDGSTTVDPDYAYVMPVVYSVTSLAATGLFLLASNMLDSGG